MRRQEFGKKIFYMLLVTVVLTNLILGSFMMMLLTDEKVFPGSHFFGFGILFNILPGRK